MTKRRSEAAKGRRHLDRLETLIDSVYALVIVFIVAQLPNPIAGEGYANFREFLNNQGGSLITPLIGLILAIVYWLQNNMLFGYLERTENMHATLAKNRLPSRRAESTHRGKATAAARWPAPA